MVFIKDAKKEFLDQIVNKILYTVIPIEHKQALEDSYNPHRQVASHIVLINCAGTLDIVEILQPPENAVFYLIDSLRPLEVRNVYNGVQIKIVVLSTDLLAEQKLVPDFEEIFDEEEEADDEQMKKESGDFECEEAGDDEEESDEEATSKKYRKRRRFDAEYLEKMHKKREWGEKRQKILFEYYKYTYHRCSSSVVLFDLAWKCAKDNNDLLWWSIIGLTEQLVNAKIDCELYTRHMVDLRAHVTRLNHKPSVNAGNQPNENSSINSLKIQQIDDLNMMLLRHWSILESIYHSIDLACLFKMWTNKGKKKLNEFLADLGLPLSECKQKYAYMDSSFKHEFKDHICSGAIKDKYRYDESLIFLNTFIASFGYCNRLTAFDMTYAVSALVENNDPNKSLSDKFIEALNCLNRENLKILEVGLDLARTFFRRIFQQLQNFIEMNQIVASGPFLHVFLEEASQDKHYFAQLTTSKRLARYALQSYLCLTKGKKVRNMPFILCVPLSETTTLITGVPPYRESNNTENCFGLAFDEAAEKTKSRVQFSYFDTSSIEINNEDRSKFLDALVAVMQ